MLSDDEILKLWRSPTFEGSYSGIKKFQLLLHTNMNEDVSEYRLYKILKKDPIFIIHQRSPKEINRRKYDIKFYGELVQIDIAYMYEFEGFKYFLLLIDCFSFKILTKALKSKDSQTMAYELNEMFEKFKAPIFEIESDQGTEFKGPCLKLFKEKHILYKLKQGKNKANFAELGILLIKKRLYMMLRGTLNQNWVELLPKITKDFNNTPLKSLGFEKPNSIKSDLDSIRVQSAQKLNHINTYSEPTYVIQRLNNENYEKTPKALQKNDYVYLNFLEKQFDKSFDTKVKILISK